MGELTKFPTLWPPLLHAHESAQPGGPSGNCGPDSRTVRACQQAISACVTRRPRRAQAPRFAAPSALWRRNGNRPVPTRHRRRSEEHTSELQSLMRISYAVFCLKKKKKKKKQLTIKHNSTQQNNYCRLIPTNHTKNICQQ